VAKFFLKILNRLGDVEKESCAPSCICVKVTKSDGSFTYQAQGGH
jgi:hypothetical protein